MTIRFSTAKQWRRWKKERNYSAGFSTFSAIAVGDSIMAGEVPYAGGWEPLVEYATNLRVIANGAVGGTTSAQILDSTDDLIAANPEVQWLVFCGGANDIGYNDLFPGTYSTNTIVSNLQAVAALGLAAGMKVLYVTTPPFGEALGFSDLPRAIRQHDEVASRMAEYANQTAGVFIADPYSVLLDPAQPGTDIKLAAYRGTGGAVHLTVAGAIAAGAVINQVVLDESLNSAASDASTVLARYTGMSTQDSNSIRAFVFRLARIGQWANVREIHAFRQSVQANALKGMRQFNGTLRGAGGSHTAKLGFSLTCATVAPNTDSWVDVGYAINTIDSTWASRGLTVFGMWSALGKNGNVNSYLFGTNDGVQGTTGYYITNGTNQFVSVVESGFGTQTHSAVTLPNHVNKFVAIGRTGAWSQSAVPRFIIVDNIATPVASGSIANAGVTGMPADINFAVNGVASGATTVLANSCMVQTATLFGVGDESLNLYEMKRACEFLEVTLAA